MKIRKRYILLILIALLPLFLLIHPDDYCFGVADLLIITGLVILFVIVFLVVVFNNLYSISLRKELFNFRPLIIAAVYAISLFFFVKYHDKNIFKTKSASFKIENITLPSSEIVLFEDNTFEFKSAFVEYTCVYKGTYKFKKQYLFLDINTPLKENVIFDLAYTFKKEEGLLVPKNQTFPNFKKQK